MTPEKFYPPSERLENLGIRSGFSGRAHMRVVEGVAAAEEPFLPPDDDADRRISQRDYTDIRVADLQQQLNRLATLLDNRLTAIEIGRAEMVKDMSNLATNVAALRSYGAVVALIVVIVQAVAGIVNILRLLAGPAGH